jgi:hypothetical protein
LYRLFSVEEWCSENEYEYIELELNEKSNLNCNSDDKETSGAQRVLEVLQTHQWSNMQLKSKAVPVFLSTPIKALYSNFLVFCHGVETEMIFGK